MKKSVLKVYESKESILKLGNHGVSIKPRPLPVRIIDDKTLESVEFTATRVFYYFQYPVCVVNDEQKTFRLSHAGIYATDKATGETKEGEWPKTTTQTLMMYRDLCHGDGYTEIEPIEGRAAIDWRAHMDEYNERKAMIKAGIIPPRKTRAKKAKVNEAMLELLEKEFGLSREQVLAKMAEKTEPAAPNLPMCLPAPATSTMTADMVHAYFTQKPVVYTPEYLASYKEYILSVFSFEMPYFTKGDHADADWWENEYKAEIKQEVDELYKKHDEQEQTVVIDADYIKKLQDEAKEIGKKNPSKKTKKTADKKTTAKKTTKKSLGEKVAKNAKKATAKTTKKTVA